MDQITYLTVITNIEYVQGFFALYDSLIKKQSVYNRNFNFAVLIPEKRTEIETSLNIIKEKTKWNFEIIKKDFNFSDTDNIKIEREYWRETYFKLLIFGLTQYKKIVYLDSDMYVNSDIGELLCCEHMAAVASNTAMHPNRNYLTSAVLVIAPDKDIEIKLFELYKNRLAAHDKKALIGDEQIIRDLFSDWWISQNNLHLPIDYCVNFLWTNYMIKKCKYNIKATKILHFSGPTKPWNYSFKNKVAVILRCVFNGNFYGMTMLRRYLQSIKKYKKLVRKV